MIDLSYELGPESWDMMEVSKQSLCILPLTVPPDWVVKRVKDLSRWMQISFFGIEYKVEELVQEIEQRRDRCH